MKKGYLFFTELDSTTFFKEKDAQIREIYLKRHIKMVQETCKQGRIIHKGTRGVVLYYKSGVDVVYDAIRLQKAHKHHGELPPLPGLKIVILYTDFVVDSGVVLGDLVPLAFLALRDAGSGELLVDSKVAKWWDLYGNRQLSGVSRVVKLGHNSLIFYLVPWSGVKKEPKIISYERGKFYFFLMLIPSVIILFFGVLGLYSDNTLLKREEKNINNIIRLPPQVLPIFKSILSDSKYINYKWYGDRCLNNDEENKLCLLLKDRFNEIKGYWELPWDKKEWIKFFSSFLLKNSTIMIKNDYICAGYKQNSTIYHICLDDMFKSKQ